MSEQEPQNPTARRPGELNEPQQRRLSVTCKYIDGLLCEIEQALDSAASKSPFPRYVVDVTPAQTHEIENHILRLRAELLRALAWQHLGPEPPEIPVTRSILTDLSYVDNAIEELKPRYLRGCGPIPPDAVDELNEAIRGLQALVGDMEKYVRHEVKRNQELNSRLSESQ
ncbi:MAG: hypothetical protein WCA11_11985 [Terracidiphilus sp.]